MPTPNPLPMRCTGAALAIALCACACGRSDSATAPRGQAHAVPAADAKDIPYMVRPVIVRGPARPSSSADGDDAAPDTGPGREAALRYMARRGGSEPDAEPARQSGGRSQDVTPPDADATPELRPSRAATGPSAAAGAPQTASGPADSRTPPPAAVDVPAPRVDDLADARSLNRRGIALIAAGRPEQAIPVLERAIALQPRDAEMLGNLGYAYMLAGENGKARARLIRALDLAPTRSATWLNLGQTYAELGRRDAAVDAVVKGYRYSTRKPSVLSALQRAATGARYSAAWREAAGLALGRIGSATAPS